MDKNVVLLALPDGDRSLIPFHRLAKMNNVVFLSPFSDVDSENVHAFPRHDLRFPDLVSASDAVLSKPGYGIVAECYANRTPLFYVNRPDFRECHVLISWMKKNNSD